MCVCVCDWEVNIIKHSLINGSLAGFFPFAAKEYGSRATGRRYLSMRSTTLRKSGSSTRMNSHFFSAKYLHLWVNRQISCYTRDSDWSVGFSCHVRMVRLIIPRPRDWDLLFAPVLSEIVTTNSSKITINSLSNNTRNRQRPTIDTADIWLALADVSLYVLTFLLFHKIWLSCPNQGKEFHSISCEAGYQCLYIPR